MAAKSSNDCWIAHARLRPDARLRLFCFPFAGGSAAVYRGWEQTLPESVEVLPVELPGRSSRFREESYRRLDVMVSDLADALAPRLDRSFAFFGHSMGALISFELARELRRRGADGGLAGLFVSARRAPQIPLDEDPVYTLPEDEFIAKLRELNGTPEEVLDHPELMQMMTPILRADFEVNETYEFREQEPLACPIFAYGGLADDEVPKESLEAWRSQTGGGFQLRMLPGDHFYLTARREQLLWALGQELSQLLAATT